ncbi:Lck-interacting transmembrane adapter 1 [Oryzias melastigma]|uniref:Lck interacting transmembrane adaptor 1 n=1 Tax=Oryzias melastigma TaxID=30732 RepID=A0A3B3C017_ORYME|nr:trithorax group protein osa isoform X1 [Oryzias melastigma]XP_036068658.1 trithorax group protein osa isoform X1 [Oryzias melastigma]XP_036068660.1 trithorax group protein osa isoform X1 [Oryzias melastigma]KAF6730456.1 Lck-interacting transmembrane adapter 1 [Oryzias melastigma]
MEHNGDTNPEAPTYQNLLLLGAIAAASAFVVTILIVLVCVGCQRKSKSKHPPAGEKGTSVNLQGTLRHPKLNSMSKSDTRLHEINRFPCNGNSVSKSRPASMDLLLLHSRRSQTDLRPSQGRQLPQIPTSPQGSGQAGDTGGDGGGGGERGEVRDHTYTEVGLRNNPTPTHYLDDGLYESVGVREGDAGPKAPPAPPATSANNSPAVREAQSPPANASGARHGNGVKGNGRGNGTNNGTLGRGNGTGGANRSPLSSVNSLAIQDPTSAEYASIRKFRKADKLNRKENSGADSQSDSQSSVSDSPSAAPPALHRSQEIPRKPLEPFHLHSFPKEAVFMGNGEQYIWKPPEDDDIITLHPPPPHRGENIQGQPSPPTAKEIADTYSIVCKSQKKRPPMEHNGAKTLPRSFGGDRGNQGSRGRGRGVQGQARSQEEPCYEPVGDRSWSTPVAESDPAYASIDTQRKREQGGASNITSGGSATLKRKKQATQQQQPPAPAAPQASGPNPPLARGLPGGENFYETISDVKQGANSSSTTTIFTFNDGMEMYVTGL